MASLVAYCSSDSDDNDEGEQQVCPQSVIAEDKLDELVGRKQWEVKEAPLPPPAKKEKRGPVKLVLPELGADDDSDEETPGLKLAHKSSSTGGASKLLSMLPPPTSEKKFKTLALPKPTSAQSTVSAVSFMPRSLTKQTVPSLVDSTIGCSSNIVSPLPASSVNSNNIKLPISVEATSSSDDDDDDAGCSDFFSFNSAETVEPIPSGSRLHEDLETFDQNDMDDEPSDADLYYNPQDLREDVHPSQMYNAVGANYQHYESPESATDMSGVQVQHVAPSQFLNQLPPNVRKQLQRDEQAMWELDQMRGPSGGSVEVVDASADKVLGNVKERLLKNYSEEKHLREMMVEANKRPKPSKRQKAKHQITFLTHYAKSKEAELTMTWAANKQTRRQTQQKYGFL